MTSRYTGREAECLNCRNNLQEGRGKNELCWGWWGEHTEKNRKYTPGNTAEGGKEDKQHSQH